MLLYQSIDQSNNYNHKWARPVKWLWGEYKLYIKQYITVTGTK